MIKVYNAETGALLGEISEDQLQLLVDQLEEESSEDQDYYINQATIDLLAQRGASSELLAILRQAVGERGEADIRWSQA
jgi:processive 1,2-diacylglycerol beta-glucosyltransferase